MTRINRLFMLIIISLLILISLPSLLYAQSSTILTDTQETYPLGLHLEYLEDKDGLWTIEDITSPELSQQFVPSEEETPGFGFTNSAYWVKFQVRNEADTTIPWLLVVDSYLFYIDVYVPTTNGDGFDVVQTGTARPYDARAIDHPKFLFDLPIPSGAEQTIFARFESESAMNLSLSVSSAHAIAQDDLVSQILSGFLYGVLLIMAAYNFILFIYLRDTSYLYYVLFLTTLLLAYLTNDAIAHKYLWPNQGRINAIGGQVFFTLLLIFILLFTNSFLQLQKYAPRLRKGLFIVVGVLCLMLPLQWINLSLPARLILILTIISFVLVIASGILVWRKGYRPARYFLLAWGLLLFSLLLFVFSLFGVASLNLFSIAGTQIGIVVLVLTLSLALADRISTYRKENNQVQAELVENQQEALRLKDEAAHTLEKMNAQLSSEFDQRTRELSFAQEQINLLFEGSPLAIGTAALDGRILTANESMKTLFGYPGEEIFEINVLDLFPDLETRRAVMEKLETDKLVQETMLPLKYRDGSEIYVNLTESILSRGEQDVLLGIVDDMTAQVKAEQKLQKQAEETAVTEERNRIARELHDSVTQTLYTTSLIAEALPKVWETHPEEARRSLEELRIMTVGSLAEMRTLLLELRPGELADRSLSELLHQLTDAMTARTDLPITTTVVGNCPIPTDVQIAFYRIAQEGLNNINKHARADRAWINLNCAKEKVTLIVGDNGRGMKLRAAQPHKMGLKFMKERAQAIDAQLMIDSTPEVGTEIKVVWHR